MRSAAKGNRQLNTRRQKNSNAGFSLIELLIAVTILAIIVIPLLHMFVTSTRINVKSRQMLRATTVAQDIMEGLKAYNLEEVRTQFAPPDGASPTTYYYPSNGFYVLNTNLIQGGVREITELEVDGEEIYYFGIENLKMQGGEYDALIKLDASTYGAGSVEGAGVGGTPAPGAHDKEFNGAFYAEIAGVFETSGGSSETDSSFHEDKDLNKAVLRDVKKQVETKYAANPDLGDLPENWDEVKLVISGDAGTADNIAIVSRNIHVLLDQAKDKDGNPQKDVEGNYQCRATITFTYKCVYKGVEYTSYGDGGMAGGKVENIYRTFSSGNFYLFYYPIYKTGGQIDTIQFEVKDTAKLFDEDKPLLKSITLAKQIRSNVDADARVIAPEMSNADLWQAEINYIMDVDVKIVDGTMKNDLVFRTNLGTNLAKDSDGKGGKEINNGNARFGSGFADAHIVQTDMTGDNVSSKITNVIYDIEITVYETGAAQHFTEANFETLYRDDVHKLASITNLD
ncbi:MAG: prepilin-type N-terminal cleavage/methylation domain-containing protein [Lachnospiraceae bacterium]|nr:prepilin-type N-terminal cleavage/methylation domain-containing protein [Lachnospiraceae bacterium]